MNYCFPLQNTPFKCSMRSRSLLSALIAPVPSNGFMLTRTKGKDFYRSIEFDISTRLVGRRMHYHNVVRCMSPPEKGDSPGEREDELFDYEEIEGRVDGAMSVDDSPLDSAIDSFLRGEYDKEFAEDAPAPHPGLTPGATTEAVLNSLRRVDTPEPSHGAAVLLRFCVPLSRAERWGGGDFDAWKEILRGAITPSMLARRIRASDFSVLLNWKSLDLTDGLSVRNNLAGTPSVAFVNAALFFGEGREPSIVQFTLRRINSVWLIDKAQLSKKELFVEDEETDFIGFR